MGFIAFPTLLTVLLPKQLHYEANVPTLMLAHGSSQQIADTVRVGYLHDEIIMDKRGGGNVFD